MEARYLMMGSRIGEDRRNSSTKYLLFAITFLHEKTFKINTYTIIEHSKALQAVHNLQNNNY